MKVSFMQRVDFWFGIPLCAIFSVLNRLINLIAPSRKDSNPRKILFIELSEMGSAIIAHAAISRAKTQFGAAEIFFLVFERNREGVDLLKLIPSENILSVRDNNLVSFVLSLIKTLWRIRRLGIDATIDMELFSRCTALISFLTGAKKRVGFDNGLSEGLYRGRFLTHPVFYNHHQHMSVNFMALVMSLGVRVEHPMLKMNVSELALAPAEMPIADEEKEASWKVLRENSPLLKDAAVAASEKRFIIFNPDPGLLPLRGWPLDRFATLASKLVQADSRNIIVVIGLGRSKIVADRLAQAVPASNFIDLCGKTKNLREVLALFSISHVLITNDSGPAHIASLSKIRSFVFFGPETPALYGPLGTNTTCFFAGLSCSPCYAASNHRRSACKNNECLKAIPVDGVFDYINSYLSNNA